MEKRCTNIKLHSLSLHLLQVLNVTVLTYRVLDWFMKKCFGRCLQSKNLNLLFHTRAVAVVNIVAYLVEKLLAF
jgi:hypothetical protein